MSSDTSNVESKVGKLVAGRYKLLQQIGSGGMGVVYAAQHHLTKRLVAVKMLHVESSGRSEHVARFMQEAELISKIVHPNIVEVFDMGQDPDDSTFFIAQTLLEGRSLRKHLRTLPEGMAPAAAVDLIIPLLGALVAVHKCGIIHRDIKPENIFLADSDHGEVVPKLLDFGISKATGESDVARFRTGTGVVLGTPDYLSREQALGDPTIDARTDIWSIGIVLYEMLSGRVPYKGNTAVAVIANIMSKSPPRIETLAPRTPPGLAKIVHRAVAPDRADRYPSALEFLSDLLALPDFYSAVPEEQPHIRFRRSLPSELHGRPGRPSISPVKGPKKPTITGFEDTIENRNTPAAWIRSLRASPDRTRMMAFSVGTIIVLGAVAAIWSWQRPAVSTGRVVAATRSTPPVTILRQPVPVAPSVAPAVAAIVPPTAAPPARQEAAPVSASTAERALGAPPVVPPPSPAAEQARPTARAHTATARPRRATAVRPEPTSRLTRSGGTASIERQGQVSRVLRAFVVDSCVRRVVRSGQACTDTSATIRVAVGPTGAAEQVTVTGSPHIAPKIPRKTAC
jgi:serine/threonine protein kinase